jgi:hypothetical protein
MLFQLRSLRITDISYTCVHLSIHAQNSDARLTNLGPQIKAA